MADPVNTNLFSQMGTAIKDGQQESFDKNKSFIRLKQQSYVQDAENRNSELKNRAEDLDVQIAAHIADAKKQNADSLKELKESIEDMITSDGINDFTSLVRATGERAKTFNDLLNEEVNAIEKLVEELSDDFGVGTKFNEVFEARK